jgi:hypothetical protein
MTLKINRKNIINSTLENFIKYNDEFYSYKMDDIRVSFDEEEGYDAVIL